MEGWREVNFSIAICVSQPVLCVLRTIIFAKIKYLSLRIHYLTMGSSDASNT